MARTKSRTCGSRRSEKARKATRLFTLEVNLIAGPTDKLPKKKDRVTRTIQIRGDQTLEELHFAIFDAYDREDEHLYEFQFGDWKKDRGNPRFVHPIMLEDCSMEFDEAAGATDETMINDVGLDVGQVFRYWFDFGDDWWHQIDVLAIEDEVPAGKFPRVTNRVGESPPQYDYGDEDDDYFDEDDD